MKKNNSPKIKHLQFTWKSLKKFKTHLQFYMKISIKKFSSFFTWKSLVNFFQKSSPKNWIHLQFYKRNPYKKNIFNFTKEILLKFLRFSEKWWILQKKSLQIFLEKKIDPDIWSQKHPLGSTSWRPFFQKPSPRGWFWKFLGQHPNLSWTSFPKESCSALFYTNVVITQDPPLNISENEKI